MLYGATVAGGLLSGGSPGGLAARRQSWQGAGRISGGGFVAGDAGAFGRTSAGGSVGGGGVALAFASDGGSLGGGGAAIDTLGAFGTASCIATSSTSAGGRAGGGGRMTASAAWLPLASLLERAVGSVLPCGSSVALSAARIALRWISAVDAASSASCLSSSTVLLRLSIAFSCCSLSRWYTARSSSMILHTCRSHS